MARRRAQQQNRGSQAPDLATASVVSKTAALAVLWQKWWRMLVGTVSVIGSLASIMPFIPDEAFVQDQALFPPPFNAKGAPDLGSLDLTNRKSPEKLDCFLEQRSGDPEERRQAESCLRRVIELEEKATDRKTVATLYGLLGHLYLTDGRIEEALPLLRLALERSPQNACLLLLLWSGVKRHREALLRTSGLPYPAPLQERVQGLTSEIAQLEEHLEDQGIDVPRELAGAGCLAGETAGSLQDCVRQLLAKVPAGAPDEEPVRFTIALTSFEEDPVMPATVLSSTASLGISRAGLASARRSDLLAPTTIRLRLVDRKIDQVQRFRDLLLLLKLSGHSTPAPQAVPAARPRATALAAGVNDYAGHGEFSSLLFATRDAVRVTDALRNLGYATDLQLNGIVQRASLVRSLETEVEASRPGDQFVFYFSGHGVTSQDGKRALVLPAAGGGIEPLSLVEVSRILSHHRGEAIILVDSCFTPSQVALEEHPAPLGPHPPRLLVAGAPDQIAVESIGLRSGTFTQALVAQLQALRWFRRPDGPAVRLNPWALYTQVGADTERLTLSLYGLRQTPELLTTAGPGIAADTAASARAHLH